MITFAAPVLLWALAVFPFLVALYLHGERSRRLALNRLIAARLQLRLAGSVSVGRRRVIFALTMLGLALAILAMARPQWGFSWDERKEMGRDVLIAVDTSRSMLAADLQPSRLKRAKLAAEDLLTHLKGDRVGVIAFAGSSFLQAPLTSDFAATKDTLSELDTDIIPRGGTNLTEAITAANDAFGKGESDQRALIIFTDGEELEEDAVKSAREHKDKFRIFTVGLGSVDGALIPMPGERGGTQFVKDEKGEYVKSKLDEKRLREVAEAGGGFYVHLQNGPTEMRQIATEGLGKMKEATTNESHFSKRPTERYQWPLAAAVACWIAAMLVGERKRVAVILMLLSVNSADAASTSNEGQNLFAKADYAGAAKVFEEQRAKRNAPEIDYNLGISAYKAGDLDKAAEALASALGGGETALQSKAAFGLANVLARRGVKQEAPEDKLSDWKNAIQHYDRTLALNPTHPDAAHNRDLLKKLLADEQKKQDEQKKDEDKKDDKKDQEKKKDEESKDGEKKDGEKKDGEKKDGESKDGEKKDGEKKDGESKDGEKKDGESKDGEKKDGEKNDGESKDGENKDGEKKEKSDKPGEKPEKAEQQKDGEKKQGELKAANPGEKADDKEQQAEAAEDMAAAKEGRMTQKNAKELLDSMLRTERRVRLLDPRQEPGMQNKPRPEKNW